MKSYSPGDTNGQGHAEASSLAGFGRPSLVGQLQGLLRSDVVDGESKLQVVRLLGVFMSSRSAGNPVRIQLAQEPAWSQFRMVQLTDVHADIHTPLSKMVQDQ